MNEQSMLFNFKPLRRTYSYVGICYTVLLITSTLAQLAMVNLPFWLSENAYTFTQSPWWTWLCISLPMYAVAMPLCYGMMRRFPANPPEKQPLTAKQILVLIPICVFFMYAGNFIGSALSLLLSGGSAENAVAELAMDNHPLKVLVMVIAAPIFEEWICRKVLLDRVRRYGSLLSAVMSGTIFGLLHQNFFQFFYAFALGFVFSWIYLRCGSILVPILFHVGVNFLGGVVAPALLSLVDLEALQTLDIASVPPDVLLPTLIGLLAILLYGFIMFGLSVTGLILLITNRRHIVWEPSEWDMPLKTALKPALLNVGMILYTLLCAGMFVFSLVAG